MAQVIYMADRSDIVAGEGRWVYEELIARGIEDSEIRDRSYAVGKIVCCDKERVANSAIRFYAPPGVELEFGDFVEIRWNSPAPGNEVNRIIRSTAIRIRERAHDPDGVCRWYPDDANQVERVIHCDWMEPEGWIHDDRFGHTWYKPAGGSDGTDSEPVVGPESADPTRRSANIIAVTALEAPALHVELAESSLWVLNGTRVSRVEPETGRVLDSFDVRDADVLVGHAVGSIWVSNSEEVWLDRYDPGSGGKIARIRLRDSPSRIVEAGGTLWISSFNHGMVQRIDPDTNQLIDSIKVGKGGTNLLEAHGAMWLADEAGRIVPVDIGTGKKAKRIRICRDATGLAADEDGIWIACSGDGSFNKVDPASGRVFRRMFVGGHPYLPIARGHLLWFRDAIGPNVFELDTETGKVRVLLTTASRAFGMQYDSGALWVTDVDSGDLIRLEASESDAGV